MTKDIRLIYIGTDFYHKSSTIMSSIYDMYWERWDWGKVGIALDRGDYIHIRPATGSEMDIAYTKLDKLTLSRR